MRKRKKVLPYLLIAIVSLAALVFFILFVDPFMNTQVGSIALSPVFFFFMLLSIFLFSILTFICINIRLGTLLALFILSVLFLQFIGFFNILYVAILILVIILIELGFRHK
ncbi:MAG: hypothetical protein KA035_03455 [Candidatus Levybacteria bacterium]|nr:hypothetical protein [Candidatus Levybacteria bacterium]